MPVRRNVVGAAVVGAAGAVAAAAAVGEVGVVVAARVSVVGHAASDGRAAVATRATHAAGIRNRMDPRFPICDCGPRVQRQPVDNVTNRHTPVEGSAEDPSPESRPVSTMVRFRRLQRILQGDLMPTSFRLRAPLILVFGAAITVLGLAGPANAATHQPTSSVSDVTPARGSALTFCAKGFQSAETMKIHLANYELSSPHADASGAFCATFVVPPSLTGSQSISALGVTSGMASRTDITIDGFPTNTVPTTTSRELAVTGTSATEFGAIGGLFLAAGGLMVVASKRRKTNP